MANPQATMADVDQDLRLMNRRPLRPSWNCPVGCMAALRQQDRRVE